MAQKKRLTFYYWIVLILAEGNPGSRSTSLSEEKHPLVLNCYIDGLINFGVVWWREINYVMWCDVWCVIICVECTLHSPVLILRLRSGHPQPPTASDSGVASALGRSPYLTLQTSALLSIEILPPVTVLIHRSSVTVSVYVCVYVATVIFVIVNF